MFGWLGLDANGTPDVITSARISLAGEAGVATFHPGGVWFRRFAEGSAPLIAQDAWVEDLDADASPEILVWQDYGHDSGRYQGLFVVSRHPAACGR